MGWLTELPPPPPPVHRHILPKDIEVYTYPIGAEYACECGVVFVVQQWFVDNEEYPYGKVLYNKDDYLKYLSNVEKWKNSSWLHRLRYSMPKINPVCV